MSGRSDLVDVEVYLHHETEPGEENTGAYLVSTDFRNKVWVPKSQCQLEGGDSPQKTATLTCRESLAIEKGLV